MEPSQNCDRWQELCRSFTQAPYRSLARPITCSVQARYRLCAGSVQAPCKLYAAFVQALFSLQTGSLLITGSKQALHRLHFIFTSATQAPRMILYRLHITSIQIVYRPHTRYCTRSEHAFSRLCAVSAQSGALYRLYAGSV